MSGFFESIVLGAIQGLTELLPISSSAHLVIAPWAFGWKYQGLTYDVALHLGTLLGVIFYFRKKWVEIIKSGFTKQKTVEKNMLWFLAAATVPAGIAGIFLETAAETFFRNPKIIAVTLISFGLLLYFVDKAAKRRADLKLNFKSAIIIGLFQALAIVPGVSRSGITMTAALLLGFTRQKSAEISFLMAVPIILGASIFELRHISIEQLNINFFSGFIISALTGWLAVKFLMSYVKTHSFNIFVVYRIILGFLILLFI